MIRRSDVVDRESDLCDAEVNVTQLLQSWHGLS
jgi:hypothetical protein